MYIKKLGILQYEKCINNHKSQQMKSFSQRFICSTIGFNSIRLLFLSITNIIIITIFLKLFIH